MVKNGFYLVANNKGYFIEDSRTTRTDNVCKMFINAICNEQNLCDDFRDRCLHDVTTIKDIRKKILPATLRKNTTVSGYEYYSIVTKYSICNFTVDEFKREVIVLVGKCN